MERERTDGEDALYRKVTRRFLPFLMICYAVAYLDRINVGIAKLGMSHDLGLSEAVFGLGAGIFFIGYFLFEVPSNALLYRLGARVWIARIMVSWAIVSAGCALAQGPVSFYVARFLLGVTEAGFFPGIILYLTYWYPSARRGRIVAMFMTAIPIAGVVGTPISGFLMSGMDGLMGWAGWRWMLVAEALPALLLGLCVPFVLDSRVVDAKWLSEDEKRRLAERLAHDHRPDAPAHAGLRDLVADPAVLRFAAIYFCCIMGQYGITFWLPTLVSGVSDAPTWVIGLYASLPYAAAVVTMLLVSRSSDLRQERRWHLILPMVVGAAAIALAPLAHGSTGASIAILCVAAAAILTATPLFWNLPTTMLQGVSAAIGIAAINSVGNLAGFVSPMVVGWLNDRTGATASGMWALAFVLVVGALLVVTARAPGRSA
ncbi:MFS transporter [Sphingomonas naphthae]|uniref:MFS transporter n=1 Tax=Sphingomonas naphthae TaxID=1813468 RepID=A0ABY7TNB3_9SPHN|nr:MFS transporter [Sphingomonas naphthae]WCT74157.1 MFS transporter [Sphingomonas naphthae]